MKKIEFVSQMHIAVFYCVCTSDETGSNTPMASILPAGASPHITEF